MRCMAIDQALPVHGVRPMAVLFFFAGLRLAGGERDRDHIVGDGEHAAMQRATYAENASRSVHGSSSLHWMLPKAKKNAERTTPAYAALNARGTVLKAQGKRPQQSGSRNRHPSNLEGDAMIAEHVVSDKAYHNRVHTPSVAMKPRNFSADLEKVREAVVAEEAAESAENITQHPVPDFMASVDDDLDAVNPNPKYDYRDPVVDYQDTAAETPKQLIVALAGGTGASLGDTGNILLDRDLALRMRLQDEAALLLLLLVYFVTLFFSASLAYRQAGNNSPVSYYADPRFYTSSMEGHDPDLFIEAFNTAPKGVHLRVAGFTPSPEDSVGGIMWRGDRYSVDFTFALDLSPWIIREPNATHNEATSGADAPDVPAADVRPVLNEGVVVEDVDKLTRFLATDKNDMAIVDLHKEILWHRWEDLATNIKHQIRQSGFNGIIGIDRTENDIMSVYKNKRWANFMHSKALKVILALSMVGWLFYVPYMWLRCKSISIRSYYRVDIDISEYWRLINENLSAHGFELPGEFGDPMIGMTWNVVDSDSDTDRQRDQM